MTETATKTTTSKAAAPPKVGALVSATDDAGNVRVGLVVADGRTPDKDKGESPEPLVAWLPDAAAFGGELTPLS